MTNFDRAPLDEAITVALAVERYAPQAADAAAEMTDLAALRALPGPVIVGDRSFRTEALEELADGRNYLVWLHRLRSSEDCPDNELVAIDRAIATFAVAWQHVTALTDHAHPDRSEATR